MDRASSWKSYQHPSHHLSQSSRDRDRVVMTYDAEIIQQHIPRIPQLSPNRRKPQHRIHALCIARNSRSAEMLDELAHAHQLARRAELLFRGFERGDAGCGAVGAVQVPGEEAREVLQSAEHFVAADWGVLVVEGREEW
jgi:hypothetical protein